MDTAVEQEDGRPHRKAASSAGRYIRWLGGGAIATLAALAGLYAGTAQTEYLPPPPLSNTLCIDEKLAFLRDHPPVRPDFLVVGSSIAYRNIDSSVLARKMPGSRPVNGALCGVRIHQAVATAEWLMEQWPSVDEVLLLVGPQDFENCRSAAAVFDFEDATRFVFKHEAAWKFHLRYFDPVSFVRNALVRAQRPDNLLDRVTGTVLTSYGDGPIQSPGGALRFGHLPSLDQSCFDALRSFAMKLSSEGRTVMAVATPLHPEWKASYDAAGTVRHGFAQSMSKALAGAGAAYWDADKAGVLSSPEAFFDAVHLRWSAADNLTEQILLQVHPHHTRHPRVDKASMVNPCPRADDAQSRSVPIPEHCRMIP